MTSSEPRNPTDFDHFVRFVVACIAFAFLCIALVACGNQSQGPKYVVGDGIDARTMNTYVIDGCEYLGSNIMADQSAVLTHKGNCSNPIHCTCDTVR